MKKITLACFFIVLTTAAAFVFIVMPLSVAATLPSEMRVTETEFLNDATLQPKWFLTQESNRDAAVADEGKRYIDIKLFNLIKIKRIDVDILPFEQVAAGGLPIGFVAKINGVVVLEDSHQLQKGDIIRSINQTSICSIGELNKFLASLEGKQTLNIEYERGGNTNKTKIEAELGKGNGKPLGLWLKDETSGVGILTYVNPANNNFASLGHRLTDYETGQSVDLRGGDVYSVNTISIEKSKGKKVGQFRSTLKAGSEGKQGNILSSNSAGVFGCLFADSKLLLETSKIYPVATRYNVKPGAAKLRTSLDGETVQEYDIEILKTRYQKKRATKSMIIRITDRALLEQTGGIAHGMSGSPIIQNGKIVGALTHVILGDTTKGYGIYIDFVIP